jgi:tetratricopeptide (TPR) repeat protein
VAACLITYWSSLDGAFISDDLVSIVKSETIRDSSSLRNMLVAEQDTSFAGRPVVQFSFAITHAFADLDVMAYHAGNVLIHALCMLLVFAIVRRTIEAHTARDVLRDSAAALGFASALIWGVHPLNTDSVTYLSQRTESMMGLFYLLTMYASIRALESRSRGLWQFMAVTACALGMGSKESMVTAPVVVALYDRVYVFSTLREAVRSRGRLYAGLAATWLILAILPLTGARGEASGFSTEMTPWTYLLNQAAMIMRYLYLTVWPRSLVVDYGWAQPLTLADVWPQALGVVALLLISVLMLVRYPRAGFLLAWFFITLSPTTSIVPIPNEVGRECRMYLPLAGLVVLTVVGTVTLWEAITRASRALGGSERTRPTWTRLGVAATRPWLIGGTALTVVAIPLAAATIARNREYRTPLVLYRTMVERWPTPRTHQIYATMLIDAGRTDEAIPHLRVAADGAPIARHDLGVALFRKGQLIEAVEELRQVIAVWESPPVSHPHWQPPVRVHIVSAFTTIGAVHARQDRWQEAIAHFRRALAIDPEYADARGQLSDALLRLGQFDEAAESYQEYLKLRPRDAGAATNLGIALIQADRLDEAIAAFRRAADLDPRQASRNLANALFEKGEMDQALTQAQRAVAAAPDDPGAHDVLGRALAAKGRHAEAVAAFEQALRINPEYEEVREHLARVRSLSRR